MQNVSTHILVKLGVKDFELLKEFEVQASRIMRLYQGRIVCAFETIRHPDGTGEEVHVLEFPNETCFMDYTKDEALAKLAYLRNKAISHTDVQVSLDVKTYN